MGEDLKKKIVLLLNNPSPSLQIMATPLDPATGVEEATKVFVNCMISIFANKCTKSNPVVIHRCKMQKGLTKR